MTLKDILAGIAILRNHYTDPDGYHLEAEHDIIFMSATDTPLLITNYERLIQLGWHQPEYEEYEPTQHWAAYV